MRRSHTFLPGKGRQAIPLSMYVSRCVNSRRASLEPDKTACVSSLSPNEPAPRLKDQVLKRRHLVPRITLVLENISLFFPNFSLSALFALPIPAASVHPRLPSGVPLPEGTFLEFQWSSFIAGTF